MNNVVSVAQFAHKYILEHSLHLLEYWFGQKLGTARRGYDNLLQRGTIYSEVDYPWGPPTSGACLLHDRPYIIMKPTLVCIHGNQLTWAERT